MKIMALTPACENAELMCFGVSGSRGLFFFPPTAGDRFAFVTYWKWPQLISIA